jgi:Ca2+-binding RTX toxin-like protein
MVRTVRSWGLAALVATVSLLAGTGSAQAATIGATFTGGFYCNATYSILDTTYVVPSAGTVTSFAFQSESDAGYQVAFKVWRPLGGGVYQVVGSTALVTLATDSGLEVFAPPAPIAVQPGDVLGYWYPDDLPNCGFEGPPYTSPFEAGPNRAPGDSGTFGTGSGCCGNLNVSAQFTPAASAPKCFGQPATIYRGSGYPGTSTAKANDPMTITGTPGNDVIYAANGNDVIDGGRGNDVICGVGGNDKIRGGEGDDQIFGSQGDDDLGGQSGNDEVIGGPGNDRVNGGADNDTVRGGDGNDILNGGDGDDLVFGGNDDDVLAGNDGVDNCQGGNGNDVLTSNGGCETGSAAIVSNNTASTTAAGDTAVVKAAEAEGTSWSDGAGVNPATESNPAAVYLPATAGGTSQDVVGGNVTANGDT